MLWAAQFGGKFNALFGWVVHHQDTIDAGGGGVADEAVLAVLLVVALNGVGIAHQHHRRGGVGLSRKALTMSMTCEVPMPKAKALSPAF